MGLQSQATTTCISSAFGQKCREPSLPCPVRVLYCTRTFVRYCTCTRLSSYHTTRYTRNWEDPSSLANTMSLDPNVVRSVRTWSRFTSGWDLYEEVRVPYLVRHRCQGRGSRLLHRSPSGLWSRVPGHHPGSRPPGTVHSSTVHLLVHVRQQQPLSGGERFFPLLTLANRPIDELDGEHQIYRFLEWSRFQMAIGGPTGHYLISWAGHAEDGEDRHRRLVPQPGI